jgi:hypothetical protein
MGVVGDHHQLTPFVSGRGMGELGNPFEDQLRVPFIWLDVQHRAVRDSFDFKLAKHLFYQQYDILNAPASAAPAFLY